MKAWAIKHKHTYVDINDNYSKGFDGIKLFKRKKDAVEDILKYSLKGDISKGPSESLVRIEIKEIT